MENQSPNRRGPLPLTDSILKQYRRLGDKDICSRCGSAFVRGSTSNLEKHYLACTKSTPSLHIVAVEEQKARESRRLASPHWSTFSEEKKTLIDAKVLAFLLVSGQPFRFASTPQFRDLMTTIIPGFPCASRQRVSKKVFLSNSYLILF